MNSEKTATDEIFEEDTADIKASDDEIIKTVIPFKVEDRYATIPEMPIIPSGGKRDCKAIFTFSEDWEGYTKTLTLAYSSNNVERACSVLIGEDGCEIPCEVYADPGLVLCGIVGYKDGSVRPSTCVSIPIELGAATDGEAPAEITPDLFAQYLERIESDNAETLRRLEALIAEAVSGEISSETVASALGLYFEDNPMPAGKSAYDYAKEGGYSGSEEEFYSDINPEMIKSAVTPKKGVDYFDGEDGSHFWTTATAPTTPNYTFSIGNLSGDSNASVKPGDIIFYSYYRYTVKTVNGSTVLCSPRQSIRGTQGAPGATPVKGTDYFTAADKAEMVNSVKSDFEENGLTVGADGDETIQIKKNYVAFTSSTGEGAYMTSEENDTLTFYGTAGDLPVQLKNLKAPSDTKDAATKEYVDGKVGALSIPTKVSDLRNDSGYIIEDDVGTYILDSSEEWTFTLANGSTVTKKVVLA